MARVHNFSAGPAALPTSVLAEIADEMMDYRGCGMSVLEMSHRSSMYQQIIDDVEATLRRLLSIPDNYRVLFLQGGATLQFAGIPHEPHAPRARRLHRDRQLCQQGIQRSRQSTARPCCSRAPRTPISTAYPPWPTSTRALPPRPQATGSTTSTSARTTPSLAPCTRAAQLRRRTAGRRCLELLSVAAARR